MFKYLVFFHCNGEVLSFHELDEGADTEIQKLVAEEIERNDFSYSQMQATGCFPTAKIMYVSREKTIDMESLIKQHEEDWLKEYEQQQLSIERQEYERLKKKFEGSNG